jgi:hypothetical protein
MHFVLLACLLVLPFNAHAEYLEDLSDNALNPNSIWSIADGSLASVVSTPQ